MFEFAISDNCNKQEDSCPKREDNEYFKRTRKRGVYTDGVDSTRQDCHYTPNNTPYKDLILDQLRFVRNLVASGDLKHSTLYGIQTSNMRMLVSNQGIEIFKVSIFTCNSILVIK